MRLTIFKQDGPADFIQVAAFGDITIEAAELWTDTVQGDLSVRSASSEHLNLQAADYLLPEQADMTELSFKDAASVGVWSYGFEGSMAELDRLVDKVTVIQGRRDWALMG